MTVAAIVAMAWSAGSIGFAFVLGRVMRDAPTPEPSDDWLTDQPAEVLVPTPSELADWYALPSPTRSTYDGWA